ncbi:nicotinamide mononucleotide transporter family protein [Deinococcus maricopensis]|uniref:Nicotinamide mononucleotide transporter PnuC n=1 Tax=Deinococcus maricopensis (strain DSM 21211 / LMG 22137 / NRRL B-23946 / LB-34) TaxID=709986 RepID=E8U647_DEIML|nr:nicotinamide mononucleotide transporter family protein [Deinococcus maricopensis]ADV66536.1 nicotinamide mononucleotide transporter PnuC [Deinococcus maricopensis DSM 21211]
MTVLGLNLPSWLLDVSGALCVLVSLLYLFGKRAAYWHWSNASLLPYFLLFLSGGQWMLAGLQVTYLIFGLHGLYLWHLEARRDRGEVRFNEPVWYGVTWVASLAVFGYTVAVTDFSAAWNWVQFASVSLALVANFATTRKWAWSWPVWVVVNAVSAVYYWHSAYWALFALQFVLAGLSVYGWGVWRREERARLAPAPVQG